jgi:hypothetical protein
VAIRRAQITFEHAPLEAFVLALDSVLSINGTKFFRHLPDYREKTNTSAGGFVFHRLPDNKLESHAMTFQ